MNTFLRIWTVIMSCLPIVSIAQLQVNGTLKDDSGTPLPFASIMLLKGSDSTLVQGQMSDADGRFVVSIRDPGNYYVSARALGHHEVTTGLFDLSSNTTPVQLGTLVAPERVHELQEVVIKGEKPLFEQKIDRTVINVQSNISRAGGSALDVLQRSPGVTVDKMNNALSLSGKQGVRVMINGKISRLPMEAVVQMLDGMNAENIERIELITTPPSKYEAEGDAGMINIVMKQSVDTGTNGSISAFTGYGRRGKFGGSANVNHRTQSVNIYGDLASRHDYSRQYWNSKWTIPVENAMQKTISNNDRKSYTGVNTGTLGFDWNPGKKTSFGGQFNLFDRRWDMDAWANIDQLTNEDLTTKVVMNTIEENDWVQILGNINMNHIFNDKYAVSASVDHINYDSQNPTDYFQDFFDNENVMLKKGLLRSRKDTDIKIWTASVDLTGKVNDNLTIEAGAKGSFTDLTNDVTVNELKDNTWQSDHSLTSYATMYENIGAAYTSATLKASSKMDVQVGIRYEHTVTNIDTRADENVVNRNYGKWFPTFFMNNKINDNNSWVVSYSRRIARPSFFQLAPFVIFNDPNNFFSGNISLLPSFTDAFKVEYRYKSVLLSLQYSHDKNSISLFQPRINENNKQVSTAQNLDYRDNYSVVLSFPIQFTPWWEFQINTTGSYYTVRAIHLDDPLSLSITNFSLNGSQKFKISSGITAEVSGFYRSRQLFGVMEFRSFGGIDFGIEKKFENSNVRLSYSDVFATNKWTLGANIASENLNTSSLLDFETTIATLTYTYNFGNNKLKSKKPVKTGSREEQERLRQ